jgi:hypothetical protein
MVAVGSLRSETDMSPSVRGVRVVVHDNANVNGTVSALSVLPGGGLFAGIAAAIEAIPTMPQSGKMVVNAGNILGAAKIIRGQVEDLKKTLRDRSHDLIVQAAGADTVSTYAAENWNDNLVFRDDSYSVRVGDYIKSLEMVVGQLKDAAVQYGFTEDEITQTFGKPGA